MCTKYVPSYVTVSNANGKIFVLAVTGNKKSCVREQNLRHRVDDVSLNWQASTNLVVDAPSIDAADKYRHCEQSYSAVLISLQMLLFTTVTAHIFIAIFAISVVDATEASSASVRNRSLSNSYHDYGKIWLSSWYVQPAETQFRCWMLNQCWVFLITLSS